MRAFGLFLAAIVLAGAAGAALAYPTYWLTSGFAAWPFHRVYGRIAMLVLLVELVWLCRRLRVADKRSLGFGLPWRRFVAQTLFWGALGMMSAAAGAFFLLGTHLRIIDPAFAPTAWNLLRIFAVGLAGGISVALIEETVLRGALHTAIEREAAPGVQAWEAALLTAPLFAVLHFFAKARIPADQIHWYSGFTVLWHSFAPLANFSGVYDAFLAWLLVGLILSLTRALSGNIAAAIGLHAGWVVVLRMLQQSTVSHRSDGYGVWVGTFDGLLGLWVLPWGIAIIAVLWLTRAWWAPAGGTRANGNPPGNPVGNPVETVGDSGRTSRDLF